MKGLILKDFYTMGKNLKIYLLIIVVYAVMFTTLDGNPATAIMMSGMIIAISPLTTMAYDEQSGWYKMAGTLPVSTKDIVLSRYLFSLLMSVAAAIISGVLATIIDGGKTISSPVMEILPLMVMSILVAMFYHSISMPVMYKFGTTKGRIYTMLIIVVPLVLTAISVFAGFWTSSILIILTEHSNLVVAISILLTVLMYIGSIMLSIRIYKHKEF